MEYRFKNFSTPHCHPQSLDTASLPEAFIKREVELADGSVGSVTSTDHGNLAAIPGLYKLAKKNNLILIPGLEAYFRDPDDQILDAAGRTRDEDGTHDQYWVTDSTGRPKYAHVTMHAQDQVAYEALIKIHSRSHSRLEKHGSEAKPLMDWAMLEELGQYNVTMGSSCLIGIVSRHLLMHDDCDMAERYYQKLRSCVKPGNFFVEAFPHICDSKNDTGHFLVYQDGTEERVPGWKNLLVLKDGKEEKIKVESLCGHFDRHPESEVILKATMQSRKWEEREPKQVAKAYEKSGVLMNQCRFWSPNGDYQLGANRFMLHMAEKYGDTVLISDDSHYSTPDQKVIQEIRLGKWSFSGQYHRMSSDEAFAYFNAKLKIDESTFRQWIDNSHAWRDTFKGFKLTPRKSLPTKFFPQDTLQHCFSLIEQHGRMKWDDPSYQERLKREIKLFRDNGTVDLLPYFFVDELVTKEAANRGVLTGPGRGSAGGVLISYLLGITQVNPLKYGLSLDRFLTLDRIQQGKYPDIDLDFSEREWLLDSEKGFLKEKFGDHTCPVSTDTSLKLRSAIRDVARVKGGGKISYEIEQLAKQVKVAPQGISDRDWVNGYKSADGWVDGTLYKHKKSGAANENFDSNLAEYVEKYPEHWAIVEQLTGLVRNKGRHPCSNLICQDPISDFIPVMKVSDVSVTQFTAGSCEDAGALKFDFLGVNSLADVLLALRLIRGRHNVEERDIIKNGVTVPALEVLPFKGELYSIWELPEDQMVFDNICEGKNETVFQFDTGGVRDWLPYFNHIKNDGSNNKLLSSISDLAIFTALDRPGPLDYYVKDRDGKPIHNMLVEYTLRARGEPGTERLPILDQLLPETFGTMCFQEQLTKIFREVGGTTGIQAETFRSHVGKKQMMEVYKDKDLFMPKAIEKLGKVVAEALWQSMETFGQYGFCQAHAVNYVTISYACAFLKHHYQLEWWTAVLKNATKNEVDEKFWIHCGHLILMPDVSRSGDGFIIEGMKIRAPLSLLQGVGDKAHQQLLSGAPYGSIDDFCQKIERYKIEHATKNEAGKIRKGTSALNSTVCYNLIVSGAMDSMFPADSSTKEKLELYETAIATATGKRKPDPVDSAYLDMNQLQLYQARKKVLPAYAQSNLIEIIAQYRSTIARNPSGWELEHLDRNGEPTRAMLVNAGQLQHLEQSPNQAVGLDLALAAYVVLDERHGYADKKTGKPRKMAKLLLDLGDGRREFIQWSDKSGKLPPAFDKSLIGAVVLCVVGKWSHGRDFAINTIDVIQSSLAE